MKPVHHTAGPVTPSGQFCTECGKELMSTEEIKRAYEKTGGPESFKEGIVIFDDGKMMTVMSQGKDYESCSQINDRYFSASS